MKSKLTEKSIDKLLVWLLFISYGALSSPIPTKPGLPEILLFLLLATIALRTLVFTTSAHLPNNKIALIALGWLLLVPTVIGLGVNSFNIGDYVRDFVPMIFLTIPVLLYRKISTDPAAWLSTLANCFLLSGFLLSIRYIVSGDGRAFQDVFVFNTAPLNQCPTVIFASIYGLAYGFLGTNLFKRAILFLIGTICSLTILMAIMRAQIAIIIFGLILSILLTKTKHKTLRISLLLSILLGTLYIYFETAVDTVEWAIKMVLAKNSGGGGIINGRDVEAQAIISHVSSSPWIFLFGDGWGAKMFLPSAMDVVRFAHQALFYFLWKSGILGLVLFIAYCLSVTGLLDRNVFSKVILGFKVLPAHLIAASAALAIYSGVEMGYKMLSYSFLLCMFHAILSMTQKHPKGALNAFRTQPSSESALSLRKDPLPTHTDT